MWYFTVSARMSKITNVGLSHLVFSLHYVSVVNRTSTQVNSAAILHVFRVEFRCVYRMQYVKLLNVFVTEYNDEVRAAVNALLRDEADHNHTSTSVVHLWDFEFTGHLLRLLTTSTVHSLSPLSARTLFRQPRPLSSMRKEE